MWRVESAARLAAGGRTGTVRKATRVIHARVRDSLNRYAAFTRELSYGTCGCVLRNCDGRFVLNYFPNGNAISDTRKLEIFGVLRKAL
jgi:hypothetical protein